MRFFITGFPRSGTNLLTKCCIVGGITGNVDPTADARIREALRADLMPYDPNVVGFLEMASGIYEIPDNTVSKIGGLVVPPTQHYPIDGCKVAVMMRPGLKIEQSLTNIFPARQHRQTAADIENARSAFIAELANIGFDYTLVDFDSLVDNPATTLRALFKAGWPINVNDAATVPNTNFRHVV